MRLINSPCKDCTERHVGCHAECEKYRKAKEETEEAKEKQRLHKETEAYFADYAMDVIRRNRNRRK